MILKAPSGYIYKKMKQTASSLGPIQQNFKAMAAPNAEKADIPSNNKSLESNRQANENKSNFRQHTFNIPDKMFIHPKENELRSLCEISPFGMLITSPTGVIKIANQAFSALLGYSVNELPGKKIEEISIVNADTRKHIITDEMNTYQAENKYLHKNGNFVYVISKTSVYRDAQNKPVLLLSQITDITDRKEFEELLQQRNTELEKANAELDRFLYSTSHDLRAPLRSILGLIYIMQNESSMDIIKTYMDMMKSSVNRMDAFIKEIVDLSRNSQQDIKVEKVDFNVMVKEIFENLQYIPGAEKIDFSLEINQDNGIDFYSDVSRLRIILSNLVSNAITYHNLKQEQPFIKVLVNIKDKYGVIEVADNGRGIKKEHQEKIFDMFYRASDDAKGSGLGLYIVKEAVNKLNGGIQLKSKWGAGSRFNLRLVNLHEKLNANN